MTTVRSFSAPAALALTLVLAGAAALAAQERPLFEWTGRVDREVQLVMRQGSLQPRADRREQFAGSVSRVLGALPREDALVSVRTERGRGAVDILEQPTSANNYTAVIRIRDEAAGAADYRVSVSWRSSRAGFAGRGPGGGPERAAAAPGDRGRHLGQTAGDNGRGNDERGAKDERGARDDRRGGEGERNAPLANRGRGTLHWSGAVDDQVEILIQGRDIRYTGVRGQGTRNVRTSLTGELPRREVQVVVSKREGRGQVTVVRQPNAGNGYSAIVRVRDASAGMGRYDFDVSW